MELDLHMHSNVSLDGEFTPLELISFCKGQNLKYISLTDHNSVRGVEVFRQDAREQGLYAVTGVELDCQIEGIDLHLLGYGIDVRDERYQKLECDILEQKRRTSKESLRILRDIGICVTDAAIGQLAVSGIVTGEMIAEAALADPDNDGSELLKPYRPGGARSDNPYVNFFWDFCSQGKPAFLPVNYPSFEEALGLIHDTGGFAVLAHPSATVGRRRDLIGAMRELGMEGMEVYSSYHTEDDRFYFGALAEELGLIKTPGSDFHGKTKPSVKLGSTCPFMTDEEKRRLETYIRERE